MHLQKKVGSKKGREGGRRKRKKEQAIPLVEKAAFL